MKFAKSRFGRDVWTTWRKEKYKTEKTKFEIAKTKDEKFSLVIYSSSGYFHFNSEKDNHIFDTLDEAIKCAEKWEDRYFGTGKKVSKKYITLVNNIKIMINEYVSNEGYALERINFIEKEDDENWKVSILKRNNAYKNFLCVYSVLWISENEFKITEI